MNARHRRAAGTTAALLITLAGCAPTAPATTRAAGPDPAPGCTIALHEATASGLTITTVRRVDIATGSVEPSLVRDSPIVPRIDWRTAPPPGEEMLMDSLASDGSTAVPTYPSPGLDRVDAYLDDLPVKNGVYLGYVALQRVAVPLTVACPDRTPAEGTLLSWSDPQIGAIRCGLDLGAGADPAAQRVQTEHC